MKFRELHPYGGLVDRDRPGPDWPVKYAFSKKNKNCLWLRDLMLWDHEVARTVYDTHAWWNYRKKKYNLYTKIAMVYDRQHKKRWVWYRYHKRKNAHQVIDRVKDRLKDAHTVVPTYMGAKDHKVLRIEPDGHFKTFGSVKAALKSLKFDTEAATEKRISRIRKAIRGRTRYKGYYWAYRYNYQWTHQSED